MFEPEIEEALAEYCRGTSRPDTLVARVRRVDELIRQTAGHGLRSRQVLALLIDLWEIEIGRPNSHDVHEV